MSRPRSREEEEVCAYQGSYGFCNPGIILSYLFKGLEMFWNLAMQVVLGKFWKSKNSYKSIFSSGESTSHTLSSSHGSFDLCYLTFKEAELIN